MFHKTSANPYRKITTPSSILLTGVSHLITLEVKGFSKAKVWSLFLLGHVYVLTLGQGLFVTEILGLVSQIYPLFLSAIVWGYHNCQVFQKVRFVILKFPVLMWQLRWSQIQLLLLYLARRLGHKFGILRTYCGNHRSFKSLIAIQAAH